MEKKSGTKKNFTNYLIILLEKIIVLKLIKLNFKKRKADFQFITASENNAWLLNIRGRDTEYAPILNSYLLIEKSNKIKFFCDLKNICFAQEKIKK